MRYRGVDPRGGGGGASRLHENIGVASISFCSPPPQKKKIDNLKHS